ncbi:hypothetical protein [Tistrella arctica]|uniref:Lipoprotein SmpA/OmlA domain-containing protein n=1 Tax=Tistrella arctica TaxID=3133430 RepID=A0ABU9YHT3_9PROT
MAIPSPVASARMLVTPAAAIAEEVDKKQAKAVGRNRVPDREAEVTAFSVGRRARHRITAAALLASTILLSGCTTPSSRPGPARAQSMVEPARPDPVIAAAAGMRGGDVLVPAAKPEAPPPPARPVGQAGATEGGSGASGASAPVAQPASDDPQIALAPVMPDIGPEDLQGLSPGRVRALMGGPVAVTEEPPATVWQYRTGSCAADLFFYLDITSQELRVVTLAVRGKDNTDTARRACLADIRARNRNGGRS